MDIENCKGCGVGEEDQVKKEYFTAECMAVIGSGTLLCATAAQTGLTIMLRQTDNLMVRDWLLASFSWLITTRISVSMSAVFAVTER